MITTVTTSTVTTITMMAGTQLAVTIGIVAVVMLMVFLAGKELVGTSLSPSYRLTARFLDIGILPMLIAFTVIVGVRIVEAFA